MPHRVLQGAHLVQDVEFFLQCRVQVALLHDDDVQIVGNLAQKALQMVYPVGDGLVGLKNQAVLLRIVQPLQYVIVVVNLYIHEGGTGVSVDALQNLQGGGILNVQCHQAAGTLLGGHRPVNGMVMDVFVDEDQGAGASPDGLQIQLRPEIRHRHIVGRLRINVLFQLLVEPLHPAGLVRHQDNLGHLLQGVVGNAVDVADDRVAVMVEFLAAAQAALPGKEQQAEPYHSCHGADK